MSTKRKNFYVYVYFDPFTQEPFYVGKGTGKRAYDHLKEINWNVPNKTRRHSKIKSILSKGGIPRIVIAYSHLTEEKAFSYEQSLIAHYGRLDLKTGILTNMSDGGEGNSGHRYMKDKKGTPYITKMVGFFKIYRGWKLLIYLETIRQQQGLLNLDIQRDGH